MATITWRPYHDSTAQVKHPRKVFLIRGNHEAADLNSTFGFRKECLERLGARAWDRRPAPERADCAKSTPAATGVNPHIQKTSSDWLRIARCRAS